MSGCKDCLEYSSTLHTTLPQLGPNKHEATPGPYMPYKTVHSYGDIPPPPGCNIHAYVSNILKEIFIIFILN